MADSVASRTRSGRQSETTEVGDLLSFEQLEIVQEEVLPVVPGSAEDMFAQMEEAMAGNVTNIDETDVGNVTNIDETDVGMGPEGL